MSDFFRLSLFDGNLRTGLDGKIKRAGRGSHIKENPMCPGRVLWLGINDFGVPLLCEQCERGEAGG